MFRIGCVTFVESEKVGAYTPFGLSAVPNGFRRFLNAFRSITGYQCVAQWSHYSDIDQSGCCFVTMR